MRAYSESGTTIGMSDIKMRRLSKLMLQSHADLHVGECVPFYFCPRSIMLYLIYRGNDSQMTYRDGQAPIIHLECDLHAAVAWAQANSRRWAFTLSNAGSVYFEDRNDLALLHEVNWEAVGTNQWSGRGVSNTIKEGKQAEFLIENSFPWGLVERVGVFGQEIYRQVAKALIAHEHKPRLEVKADWYY